MTSTGIVPAYAYSYQDTTASDTDSLSVRIACPISGRGCVHLYCQVLACLGIILATLWLVFHLYVLSQTSLLELRQNRSVIKI